MIVADELRILDAQLVETDGRYRIPVPDPVRFYLHNV